MSSEVIPEAAIASVARILSVEDGQDIGWEEYRDGALKLLEAAAPHMLRTAKAEALERAADTAESMHDPIAPDCKEWADWLRAGAAIYRRHA